MLDSRIRSVLNREIARRAGVDAWLTAPLTNQEWGTLKENGFVDAIRKREPDGVQRALHFIEVERKATPWHRPDYSASAAMEQHERALSQMLATLALHEDARLGWGISRFRKNVRKGQLLELEEIHTWLEEQVHEWPKASTGKESERNTSRPTQLSYRRYVRLKEKQFSEGVVIDVDRLTAEPHLRYLQTYAGSPLDRLRKIGDRLSEFYPWDPSEAVTFVLTGEPPQVQAITSRVHRLNVQLPACSRILLDIDPTCTPEEVADAYATARKFEFGRLRRLSEKHSSLAAFAVQQPMGSPFEFRSDYWQKRLEDWNRECVGRGKAWEYRNTRVFARDCRKAVERLCNIGDWGEDPSIPKALRDSLYTGRKALEEAGISLPK